jgi:hypothetical protein
MPIANRLSDATSIELVREEGAECIELRFKFVRYLLVLDDRAATRRIHDLIGASLAPPPVDEGEVKMPKFYQKRSGQ